MTDKQLGKFIKQWNIASSDDGICHECPLISSCEFRLKGKEVADDCYQVLAQYLLDTVNVTHAHWIRVVERDSYFGFDDNEVYYKCSNCNTRSPGTTKRCPNCGAIMNLKEKE